MTMMTASENKKKTACVTGGNGYLASMLIKQLLERGYVVHATVRDPEDASRNAHILELQSLGEMKLFKADLLVEGTFDEAVTGCDYVFHVAIPGGLNADDPEKNLIKPAIEGTLNVLRSCVEAKSIKRVVCTSSAAAISGIRLEGTGHVLNEDSWTDVEFLSTEKPPTWGYLAAKALAEKEAWKFAEENDLDLICVNPVLVVGRGLTPEPAFSAHLSLALLTGDEFPVTGMKIMQMVSGSVSIVHLEDVCRAHVFVAETEEASGRYILSKINSSMRELAAFLHKRYPQYKCHIDFSDVPAKPKLSLSSEKLIKAGFKFKHEELEKMYDEIVEYGEAVGLLSKATDSLD